jgi:hypothetical protein
MKPLPQAGGFLLEESRETSGMRPAKVCDAELCMLTGAWPRHSPGRMKWAGKSMSRFC